MLDGLFARCNVERERGGKREFAKSLGVVGQRRLRLGGWLFGIIKRYFRPGFGPFGIKRTSTSGKAAGFAQGIFFTRPLPMANG